MAGGSRNCYIEVLPFGGMVMVEIMLVGVNTLFKAATAAGLNFYVFIAYSFLIGSTFCLLPLLTIFCRRQLAPINFPLLCKIFLYALIGFFCNLTGIKGVDYSDPTLSSVIDNLTPTFTFVLAIIFRMEKLNLRHTSTHARILGTIVSMAGALIATLYVGPTIISSAPINHSASLLAPFHSPRSNWVIGGLLLSVKCLLLASLFTCQAVIMKEYPEEFVVVFLYSLFVWILSAVTGSIVDRSLEAWKLKPNIVLAAIVCNGFCQCFLTTLISTWSIRLKGPIFVAMFQSFSIVIAIVMGVLFLGEGLYLGSVIGTGLISIGFYAVLWGQANQETKIDNSVRILDPTCTHNTPLLQEYNNQGV